MEKLEDKRLIKKAEKVLKRIEAGKEKVFTFESVAKTQFRTKKKKNALRRGR